MTPHIHYLEFSTSDHESALTLLNKWKAEGYLVNRGEKLFALIIGIDSVLDAISRTASIEAFKPPQCLAQVRGFSCHKLNYIIASTRKQRTEIHLDSVSSGGIIRGWAIEHELSECEIFASIDGQDVGLFPANKFRMDLLKAGVGVGTHGFEIKIPHNFRDGMEHIVTVSLSVGKNKHDAPQNARRKIRIPIYFPAPAEDPTHTLTSESESWQDKVTAIRQAVIYGDYDIGLAAARDLIEKYSCAAFLDLGVYARKRLDGLFYETFYHRVNHRWGTIFGQSPCALGDSCCKNLDLPYNAHRRSEASTPSNCELNDKLLVLCPHRIRHFASKTFTQSFANSISAPTPRTLANFKSIADFDSFEFPEKFVLKPDVASGVAVYLMHGGYNLNSGYRLDRSTLREEIRRYLEKHQSSSFILEEFLTQEGVNHNEPFIPFDYKAHCFGGKVRFIQVIDRNKLTGHFSSARQVWVSRNWDPAPFPLRLADSVDASVFPPNGNVRAPKCLDALIDLADKIASNINSYARVDLYATERGPVLGEITSFPNMGRGFSEYGNILLGQTWEIFEGV